MDSDAGQRRQDVLAEEAAIPRQDLDVAVGQNASVRQLAPGLRGIGQHRADTALDVDPAVRPRRAGPVVLDVELLLEFHQVEPQRLQHQRPLVEAHLAQRPAARLAPELQRRREVEALRVNHRNWLTGRGVEQRRALARAFLPCAAEIAFETARGACRGVHRDVLPSQASSSRASSASALAFHSSRSASLSACRSPIRACVSYRFEPPGPKVSATRGDQ